MLYDIEEVVPYIEEVDLIVDGQDITLEPSENELANQEIKTLFSGSHTLPAFGVVFDKIYNEQIKTGYFVKLKFKETLVVNDLPFDELVFEIKPDYQGFNLMRGEKGHFNGRCIYIDLVTKNMSAIDKFIRNLDSVKKCK